MTENEKKYKVTEDKKLKAELYQTISALDAEDLRLILESWKATQELQKRPGYENAYVILRK